MSEEKVERTVLKYPQMIALVDVLRAKYKEFAERGSQRSTVAEELSRVLGFKIKETHIDGAMAAAGLAKWPIKFVKGAGHGRSQVASWNNRQIARAILQLAKAYDVRLDNEEFIRTLSCVPEGVTGEDLERTAAK